LVLALVAALGCGERDAFWNSPPSSGKLKTWAFPDAVALFDEGANRIAVLKVKSDLTVAPTFVPVEGTLVASAVTPPDAQGLRRLLLVTEPGPGAATLADGSSARLTIVEPKATVAPIALPLSRPLRGLAIDPEGAWAVLHAEGTSGGGLVVNPNELILVKLDQEVPEVRPHTLRSFGGKPQRFTFTPMLQLPGGPRRLLVVETEKDVALVNLKEAPEPDLTVQLTNGVDTRTLSPAGVVFTDGQAAVNDDARLAIRLKNDASVVLVQLVPSPGRDYGAAINVVDVGGVPDDVAFVHTDGGALALAALVSSRSAAVLVDPVTSVKVEVALPTPFTHLALVTSALAGGGTGAAPSPGDANEPDIALLWSPSAPSVSFWALGQAVGKPYRSLENVQLTDAINGLIDLPRPHLDRKLLAGRGQDFYLLDLTARTVDPFLSGTSGTTLRAGLSGQWAWAFLPSHDTLARLDLTTKHPDTVTLGRSIDDVFEIATDDAVAGASHALLALHAAGDLSATVLDADATGSAWGTRQVTTSLLLGR
jgi:hypothetical protein